MQRRRAGSNKRGGRHFGIRDNNCHAFYSHTVEIELFLYFNVVDMVVVINRELVKRETVWK